MTRDCAPFQWAATHENLALAYLALYDKSAELRRLDDALAAIAAALDGYRRAKAPFYIEKAKRLQSEIFARGANDRGMALSLPRRSRKDIF